MRQAFTPRATEHVRDYFDFDAHPENRDRKVTRGELLAMLTIHTRIVREERLGRRFWRWLTEPFRARVAVPDKPEET